MRKLILVLVCLLMALALIACSSPQPPTPTTTAPVPTTTAPKPTTVVPTTSVVPTTTTAPVPSTTPAQVTKLRFAGFFPPDGTVGQYIQAVEKLAKDRSNGRLDFVNYWSSSLLAMDQLIPGLNNDLVDLAYTTFDQAVSLMPYSQAAQVRGVVYKPWAAMMAMTEFEKIPQIADEWAKQNIRLTWASVAPPFVIIAKKPARTFEDLKGMKLQASGGESGTNIAKASGVVVVAMPTSDIYDSISKGTIDGTIYPPEYFAMYKWLEICKFIMWDANYTGTENQIGFNIKTLNKLPADVKKIITDIGDTGESADLFNAIVCIAAKQSLIDKDAPANKVEIVRWSQADQDKLTQVVLTERDKWVPAMQARGFADADVVFNKWVELYKKYDALYPAKQKAMGWGNY